MDADATDRQLPMPSTSDLVAIVDDDAATLKSIERLLQASGHATAAFASAEEFLRSNIADRITSLVLDVHLEGMSGIALYRCINPHETRVPVVFITAHDDPLTRAQAMKLGCIDFLQKPFAASLLTRALERCKAFGQQVPPRTPP